MKTKSILTKLVIPVMFICILSLSGCKNNNANVVTNNTTNASNSTISYDDSIIKKYGDLYGFVKSCNSNTFSVDKQKIIKKNEGIVSTDSGEILKFKCNDKTKILIRNTYKNGSKYEDKDGNLNDIKADKLVSVWGKEQSDGTILAENVVVFTFN